MSDEKQQFAPTAPGAWPTKPVELELPSGAKVLARPPQLYKWMKRGLIPADVLETIQALASGESPGLPAQLDAMAWLYTMCIVEPKVTLAPQEGAIAVDEIDDLDKQMLSMRLGIGLGG